MSVTRFALDNDRITLTFLLVLLAAGVSSFLSLPQNEDPGFVVRTALVTTRFPGASPERVEQFVTDKLEKAIQEIPELDFISSESKTGVSLIYANFREEFKEMRPIFDDLRRKVDRARSELPDDVVGPTVDDEFGDVFGVILSITGGGAFSYAELKEIADDARDELLLIEDVAKVEIYGAQEERIFVEYDNARLAELALSPVQLQRILQARNIIISGGHVRTEFEEIALEPSGNFESIDELKRTVIQVPGREDVIYLQDVARIERGYIDPPRNKVRATGTPGLVLAISMREGGNISRMGEEIRLAVDRVQGYIPIGIEFDYIQFQPGAVTAKIRDFSANLIQAVLIVTLVMLVFLGLRTGLVVASLIPMAMVASFFVMGVFGIGLDQMSIAALIIALGMLVDNAIVMSESILVQIGEGKPAFHAALESAAELRLPLLISSATTSAAFLPIFLAESTTGEYTAPLFKVVTITLLCSWVLSLTMIPLLCVLFLKVKRATDGPGFESRFYVLYRRTLLLGLRNRALSLGVIAAIFGLSLFGFRFVPNIFFPPNDRPTFTMELDLPAGTPIRRTETLVRDLERYMRDQLLVGPDRDEGVINWGTFIGRGAPRFILPYTPEQSAPNYAIFVVNATSRKLIDEIVPQLDAYCQSRFPDLVATVRPLALGPPSWPPIEVRISGRDETRLHEIVEQVKAKLAAVPGSRVLGDDWGARSKKLFVRIDQPRARRAGVTNLDVAISLQSFLDGWEATHFRENDDLIPITLRSVAAERQDLGKLETLNVYVQASGRSVPLKQVADVEVQWQPSVILRRDRMKTITVEAAVEPGFTAAGIVRTIRPWLKEQSEQWGLGYDFQFGGEQETAGEANASIAAKLPVAGLIILLLLVGQFNSLRRPVIILLTIPMSIVGVVFGLLVARSYFGFMTLLGIISLAGIVINNAIVLIDRIRIEIDQFGREPAQAIIESAQRRLRPILLTTCTTMGGLIPLWLRGGPMWEPMAIAIIFGLMFATALTLGMVPILYSAMFGVSFEEYKYTAAGAPGKVHA